MPTIEALRQHTLMLEKTLQQLGHQAAWISWYRSAINIYSQTRGILRILQWEPESRRYILRHLDSQKINRVIELTQDVNDTSRDLKATPQFPTVRKLLAQLRDLVVQLNQLFEDQTDDSPSYLQILIEELQQTIIWREHKNRIRIVERIRNVVVSLDSQTLTRTTIFQSQTQRPSTKLSLEQSQWDRVGKLARKINKQAAGIVELVNQLLDLEDTYSSPASLAPSKFMELQKYRKQLLSDILKTAHELLKNIKLNIEIITKFIEPSSN